MLKKYEALSKQVNLTRAFTARSVIYRYLNRTNLICYSELSRRIGCQAFVKHENHNPTGSFKIRNRYPCCNQR
jgi:threonine dehydratase